MGTNERENEEMGVVDHMDELMHLLSSAPTSRPARNELRQILAELREEQCLATVFNWNRWAGFRERPAGRYAASLSIIRSN